ncbi:acyl-ACP--UDP-N-acetylglucosamine O-acyltransferase [Taibaiella chishuiensis]|uniref:Acyl-[acyl-carrier-protein]--UDP-N-acetylglucosamine O-acyltransferase n=1 Tax=Taibaiella chishuiensis TaxID=1434707 RepID=A0A2P8CWF0_9BACT|nr:acyl-ACP--UDP-N-acetylglucosamine O-acyltransferase [Taibaiella chishuiensis]PSK89270.1 acyl-[acyl-carrier-protein]--UDP-N-acetylglucosamine O-acyltransferase [Taibaiella chishuiensis]
MIHPLTYVHPEAKIGPNVQIDPFAVIHKDVEIGEGSWIASHVTIMEGARIGKNCRIFPGAVISAIPQDLKFNGENTKVIIGDNCTIRECVTINRGTSDKQMTRLGNNCLIMAYSHIAHDCIIGNHCIFSNDTTLAGHIVIGDYVVLAGLVAVQQFVRIGSHAFVTGGSMVRKDVPPYVKAAREPLSYVGVNSVGLKRRGYSTEKTNHILDIYRLLYVRGYNVAKATRIIEAEIPVSDERDEILTFIRESGRGIMRGYTRRNTNDDLA